MNMLERSTHDRYTEERPSSGAAEHSGPRGNTIESLIARAPDPDRFRQLLSSIEEISFAPLTVGNRTLLLIDGPATYREMLDAIESAQRYVDLEVFIFSDDEVGLKFAQALQKKCEQGVEVRVIFDSVGSLDTDNEFFGNLEKAGVKLIEYHDINPLKNDDLSFNQRDHRKLLIVDGRVAFTGGINITDEYSSSSTHSSDSDQFRKGWRDTHVAVWGPAVQGFQGVFEQNWHWQRQGGKQRSARSPAGGATFAAGATSEKNLTDGGELVAILKGEGGSGEKTPIYKAYLDAIDSAQRTAWITQAYFVPDKPFMRKLRAVAGRGVDVRILVPGMSDSFAVLHASRSRYGRLLRAGVKIYETTSAFLHAKTAVIDGLWSTVGSSNLDYRSVLHNDEVNAIIIGSQFGSQMEKQFKKDIKDAKQISFEDWRKRSITERTKQYFCRWVDYWI